MVIGVVEGAGGEVVVEVVSGVLSWVILRCLRLGGWFSPSRGEGNGGVWELLVGWGRIMIL